MPRFRYIVLYNMWYCDVVVIRVVLRMSRVVLLNLISCTRGTCSYSDVPLTCSGRSTFDGTSTFTGTYSSCGILASGSFNVYVLWHSFDVHRAKLFFSFCDTFRYVFSVEPAIFHPVVVRGYLFGSLGMECPGSSSGSFSFTYSSFTGLFDFSFKHWQVRLAYVPIQMVSMHLCIFTPSRLCLYYILSALR